MPDDDDLLPDPPEGYTSKGLGGLYAEGLENELENPDAATRVYASDRIKGDPDTIVCRRSSPAPVQGRLPLGPPGRGAGFKDAPQPTADGFAAARRRETDRTRPRSDDELREQDIAKLRTLLEEYEDLGPAEDWDEGLTDSELGAFPDMLGRLERGRFPLSERQRAWVDKVIDRLGVEVAEEPEIGGEYRKPAAAPTKPDPVTPAHAKAQAFLDGFPEHGGSVRVDMGAFRKAAAAAAAGKPFELPEGTETIAFEFTGTFCADCGLRQWKSPGGVTCANGHGGAPSLGAGIGALDGALGHLADHFMKHRDRWLPFELADGRAAYPLVRAGELVRAFITNDRAVLVVDAYTHETGNVETRFKKPPTLANLAAAVMEVIGDRHPAIVPVARKIDIGVSSPQRGENLGNLQVGKPSGYTNRDDYAETGDECQRSQDCQLIVEHEGDCDSRTEQERWAALYGALDTGKRGDELDEAMKPPKPSKAEPMPPPLGVRPEQRKRRRIT